MTRIAEVSLAVLPHNDVGQKTPMKATTSLVEVERVFPIKAIGLIYKSNARYKWVMGE